MNEELLTTQGKALKYITQAFYEKNKQITQLTNNWNELKEWVKNKSMGTLEYNAYDEIRNKMKEIKEKNK